MTRVGSIPTAHSRGFVPLPRSLRPLPGEALPSFVERQAAFLGVPLITAMHSFGLVDDERVSCIENGYGIFLSPERIAEFARINQLAEGYVREMLKRAM